MYLTSCQKKSSTARARPSRPRKLKEFHLFSRLPTEIRDMIWKTALKGLPLYGMNIHVFRTRNYISKLETPELQKNGEVVDTVQQQGISPTVSVNKKVFQIRDLVSVCRGSRDAISVELGEERLVLPIPHHLPSREEATTTINTNMAFRPDTGIFCISTRTVAFYYMECWSNMWNWGITDLKLPIRHLALASPFSMHAFEDADYYLDQGQLVMFQKLVDNFPLLETAFVVTHEYLKTELKTISVNEFLKEEQCHRSGYTVQVTNENGTVLKKEIVMYLVPYVKAWGEDWMEDSEVLYGVRFVELKKKSASESDK